METSSTKKQVVVRAYGSPEQLEIEPMAEAPRPGPGELLVDVEVAGVNFLDTYQRKDDRSRRLDVQHDYLARPDHAPHLTPAGPLDLHLVRRGQPEHSRDSL